MPRYSNAWPSHSAPTCNTILGTISLGRSKSQVDRSVPAVCTPDFRRVPTPSFTWLGHATVYLQVPTRHGPVGIIFDPVFSDRCSPLSFVGPRRRIPPPCQVQDLPAVDFVVISHDHCEAFKRLLNRGGADRQMIIWTRIRFLLLSGATPVCSTWSQWA